VFYISKKYNNSPCEIKSLSNKLITSGLIDSITDEYIQISSSHGYMLIIHCNTKVRIGIHNKSLGFKVVSSEVFLSTNNLLRVIDTTRATDVENRYFYRIREDISTAAYLVKDTKDEYEDENDIIQPDNKDVNFSVNIIDLSLGGLFISTSQNLQIGDRLIIRIPLFGSQIAFYLKIQRCQNLGIGIRGYGCQFLNGSSHQFDMLSRYIIEKQQKEIKEAQEAYINIEE